MYRTLNSFVNLLISLIAIWAVYVSIEAFFGLTIVLPFTNSEAESVPYHRWQSVRIAVFLTFSYFSVLHLFRRDREYSAIYFLEIYLKTLTIVGLVFFYQADVLKTEYFVILFLGICSIIIHLARRKQHKYFSKR